MTCPRCGHDNYHAADSCVRCGAPLGERPRTRHLRFPRNILDTLLHPHVRDRDRPPAESQHLCL